MPERSELRACQSRPRAARPHGGVALPATWIGGDGTGPGSLPNPPRRTCTTGVPSLSAYKPPAGHGGDVTQALCVSSCCGIWGVLPAPEAGSHIVEPIKKVNGGLQAVEPRLSRVVVLRGRKRIYVVDVSIAGRAGPLALRDPVARVAWLTRSLTCDQVDSGPSPGPALGDGWPDPYEASSHPAR